MPNDSLVPQTAPSIPEHILRIFGDPPLLSTENPEIYFLLLRTIAQEVCPQNVIEWFWVKDLVDLTWEIRRLRRFKTVLMEIERRSRFQPPLRWRPPSDPSEDFLTSPWLPSPKPPTKADIRRANRQRDRENAELHTETGSASIFNGVIEKYEKIDRLLVLTEQRRNALLRDIKFYRQDFAHLLDECSEKIIEGQYTKTEPLS